MPERAGDERPRTHKVYASRRPECAAEVQLHYNDNHELGFTPDEARQLVETLQLALGQIEAGR